MPFIPDDNQQSTTTPQSISQPKDQGFWGNLVSTTRKFGQEKIKPMLETPTSGVVAGIDKGIRAGTSAVANNPLYRETAGAFERGNLMGETTKAPDFLPAPETIPGKAIQATGTVVGAFNPKSIIGKVIGKGASTVGKVAEKTPIISSIIKSGKNAVEAGGKLAGKVGESLFSSNFTIPAKLAKRIGIKDVSKKMIENGHVGGIDTLNEIAGKVTGRDGIFPAINRQALGMVDTPIPFDDAVDFGKKALLDIPELKANPSVLEAHMNTIQELIKPTGDIGKTSAENAFDAIQELEKRGYQYINKSTYLTPDLVSEKTGKAYLEAADQLKSLIDKAYGSTNILETLKTPENVAKITEISPKLAEEFLQAKTMADLRRIQSPYVRLNQAIELTKGASRTAFSKMGAAISAGMGTAAGAIMGKNPMSAASGAIIGGSLTPVVTPILEEIMPPITTRLGKSLATEHPLVKSLIKTGAKAGAKLGTMGVVSNP